MQVSFLPIVKGISSPGTADHQAEVFEKAANMVLEGGDTGNATVFFFGGRRVSGGSRLAGATPRA